MDSNLDNDMSRTVTDVDRPVDGIPFLGMVLLVIAFLVLGFA